MSHGTTYTPLQNIRRSSWNNSMLWRIVELVYGVTWRQSRRNHQKYKPQIIKRSAGGHDIIECEDYRETITWCIRCSFYHSLQGWWFWPTSKTLWTLQEYVRSWTLCVPWTTWYPWSQIAVLFAVCTFGGFGEIAYTSRHKRALRLEKFHVMLSN